MTIMTASGSPTIAYRTNTTATTLIRSQCRASPDGISSVSRADASRFIAPGITTPHARHRVAARQASRYHTPGDASGQPTVVIISPPELGGVRGGLKNGQCNNPRYL